MRLDYQRLGHGQPISGQGPGGGPRERFATFAGSGVGTGYKIIPWLPVYLEDKPQYLDSPGEFWFDKKGKGGRLYLRLPGDRDPNTAAYRGGQAHSHDRQRGMSHVHVRRADVPLCQRLLEPGLPRPTGCRTRVSMCSQAACGCWEVAQTSM